MAKTFREIVMSGNPDRDLVKGKIVLYYDYKQNKEAYSTGAIGAIVQNTLYQDVAFVLPLPASSLNFENYKFIHSYIKSAENPQVEILKTEEILNEAAPYVPSFSSCRPSFFIDNLLKLDVSAPGLEILDVFSPVASPSKNTDDKRNVRFSIMSGTSITTRKCYIYSVRKMLSQDSIAVWRTLCLRPLSFLWNFT